ncbi:MAG: hypothetical protein RLY87_1279 [Chloroflexota bacterium]
MLSAALFLITACGSEAIALRGVVRDAYTDAPVPSAIIQIGSSKTMTDANGTYSVDQWLRRQTLSVSMTDYETTSIDLSKRTFPQTLTAADTMVDVVLRPNVIRGVVTDAWSKQPLAGVLIQAGTALSTTTGVDGTYVIAEVPEAFDLTVQLPDYVTQTQQISKKITADIALVNSTLSGKVTDQYSGQALAGVAIRAGDVTAVTDAAGAYALKNVTARAEVSFTFDGYAVATVDASSTAALDVVLRPDILKGTLIDATTDKPIKHATILATEALEKSATGMVRIDGTDGAFTLKGMPEKGFIQVLAPGYRKLVVPIVQGEIPAVMKLEPFQAKAVYITAAVASNPRLVTKFFDQIDATELNAIVIDLKSDLRDDLGLVYYDSQVPIVKELGTSSANYDIHAILAEAKKRGIYTIARVHMFSHDNVLAEAKPEWAARDRIKGGIFYDYPTSTIKYAWLDPFNENVWDYNIALSVEAASYGFDEINFDYIRFPSLEFGADDGERLAFSQDVSSPEIRYNTIKAVLNRAQPAINAAGAFLSVDVFGFVTEGPIDIIGQSLPIMAETTDYICPMVYPSHYGPGYLGFDNPANHPYDVILRTMQMGEKQMVDTRARLRPWLQDFTLIWVPDDQIVQYGDKELRDQIRAVADSGTGAGWLLYSSDNSYTYSALGQ